MSKFSPMDDLLRNQRRRSRRGRGGGARKLLVVLVLIAAGAAAWWWYGQDERQREVDETPGEAVALAAAVVDDSVQAARAPIEVEEASEDLGTSKRDEELTAAWTEGEEAAIRGVLQKNQSVFLALQERGLSNQAIHNVVTATGEKFNFRRSRPGDEWFAQVDSEGNVTRFRYKTSPEDIWETTRTSDGGYECAKVEVPVQVKEEAIGGTVNSSLWQTMVDLGENGSLIYRFADIFAYTIDFNTETRPGDQFGLVFEKIYLNGKFLRYGRIVAGMYSGRNGIKYGFYYETDGGESGYYDENGDNLQRQFLKSPLASVRVTSTYGKRYHPVLKRMRMHHGIDYGAPTGTPIRSVADGTVTYAGYKGANGNLIVIKHASGYTTYYAHLSKISKGIRSGKRVTKKTIIGRVGSTGRSTGPHLHFGMKRHGKYVNPRKVDFARGEPLKGDEKKRYLEEVAEPLKEKIDKTVDLPGPLPTAEIDGQPSISADNE
jgi:murein DD-endopeptidase MepM/ murein hydrolase activator NlpD